MRATKFTIDTYGETAFDGFTTGEDWNGWACPYFTREQGMRVVDAHNKSGNGYAQYDEASNSFIFSLDDADDQDVFPTTNIEGRELYPIGAHTWIWEETENEAEAVTAS